MIKTIGLIAFSFGLRKHEPNPCNLLLSGNVDRIIKKKGENIIIISQWEVACGLWFTPEKTIWEHTTKGQYLDSKEIMIQAIPEFQKNGVTDVIVVAQKFIHLPYCKKIVRKAGYNIIPERIEWIGFDNNPLQTQWWCKGPIRLLLYTILKVLRLKN